MKKQLVLSVMVLMVMAGSSMQVQGQSPPRKNTTVTPKGRNVAPKVNVRADTSAKVPEVGAKVIDGCTLGPNVACSGKNFSGQILANVSLEGANLFKTNFSRASLLKVNLSRVNIGPADMSNATFRDSTLNDLSNAEGLKLTGSRFVNTSMFQARLGKCDMTKVQVEGGDFTLTNFSQCSFWGTVFTRANLRSVNMSGMKLAARNNKFDRVNFSAANLKNAELNGLVLDGVDFSNADLSGAKLSGASIKGAKFHMAKLNGADLVGVKFRDLADFTNADFTGARIQNSTGTTITCSNRNCHGEPYRKPDGTLHDIYKK